MFVLINSLLQCVIIFQQNALNGFVAGEFHLLLHPILILITTRKIPKRLIVNEELFFQDLIFAP